MKPPLLFGEKVHFYHVIHVFSHFYLCWNHFKISDLIFLCVLCSFYPVYCLPSFILYVYLLTVPISNPTMPTIYFRRPSTLTFFSLSYNGHFQYTIPSDHNYLVFIIMKVDWSESDEDGSRHTWSNISGVFFGILNR